MNISEEKKLEILLAQLQERYEALHKMRDRSMQFVLWILGLGLGMAWLLINEIVLTSIQRFVLTLVLLFIGTAVGLFIYAMENGFKANRQIMIRIEKALKLYEKDYYGISEPILPTDFSSQKIRWSGHFQTLYALIFIVFLLLIFLTWTNPCKHGATNVYAPTVPNQTQTQKVINE